MNNLYSFPHKDHLQPRKATLDEHTTTLYLNRRIDTSIHTNDSKEKKVSSASKNDVSPSKKHDPMSPTKRQEIICELQKSYTEIKNLEYQLNQSASLQPKFEEEIEWGDDLEFCQPSKIRSNHCSQIQQRKYTGGISQQEKESISKVSFYQLKTSIEILQSQ